MRIQSFVVHLRFKSAILFASILCIVISGCTPLLNVSYKKSLPPMEGEQVLPGLSDNVTVKRDNLGIPYIEAQSMDDLI
ncbi:MAG TPA: hypothetical protein PLV15_11235, partial [Smithella sp.]|nr:hypothetical protein [Smithella sp.]